MSSTRVWYIVKQDDGHCQIVAEDGAPPDFSTQPHWGPFDSAEAAIARRVGLIRAGQCRPVIAE